MSQRKIRKYLETNVNKNKIYDNSWEEAKTVLRGKFIAIQTSLKKKISNQ